MCVEKLALGIVVNTLAALPRSGSRSLPRLSGRVERVSVKVNAR
jgi:hypothetical protein